MAVAASLRPPLFSTEPLAMTVTIQATDRPDLAMTLSQQNFHWLMAVLKLPYTYKSQVMLPAEVVAAACNFRHEYCYRVDRRVSPALMDAKIAAWRGLLQARRSPAPVIAEVVDQFGGRTVDLSPDWSILGDPFVPGTQAYALQEQLSGYVRDLGQMALYCCREGQAIAIC